MKLKALENLIVFIENPTTRDTDREKALSQLNLSGTTTSEIEDLAYTYWQEYFAENMHKILSERLVIISHLLPDNVVNDCFQNTFQEYQDRKKQLGIDDMRKYWAP